MMSGMECILMCANSFKQPIGGWDATVVINMKHFSRGAFALSEPPTIWNISTPHCLSEDANAFSQAGRQHLRRLRHQQHTLHFNVRH